MGQETLDQPMAPASHAGDATVYDPNAEADAQARQAAHEMTQPGKAIYKVADLSTMFVRAYVSGNQLPTLKLGQQVTIHTDNGEGGFNETTGLITWISDKAEFTPKTIQTKDERANMVYAIKIAVANQGDFKIGMYAEVKF